ncbi:spore coat U domain-containing protein [Chimaeribacter arupi]|uniref:SCPU domain-containing protein n=2 Tax=Yersiniaceae TaxID=1903411 RepID=A0A2N5ET27_9GAMM|nr:MULTISPECIES: spore coat U domain-containing protein [Yersiniaceae]MBS0970003.1 spore coat protein U domain-containing protein [Nissabacter archeti]MDV5140037.1 spore coat U domain-containing protein [Chimaeribacter arupi]PLR40040.1 SCPU domain-containing protein [Chimaeribacter arupi]PLR51375.1 SCPU domain-containing protein [Chimaeribacter arupi]PLR53254.1 SCPU domain-containing protein [Chimaeribacter arupi]
MKKTQLTLATAALMMLTPTAPLFAGTVTGNMGVTLTVGAGCEVVGGNSTGAVNQFGTLSFGEYSSLANIINSQSTDAAGTGSLQLLCTTGTPFTVALDNGVNAAGGQRRMAGTGGAFINYNLYQEPARTTLWGPGTPLAGTGTGTPVNLIVYGQVPAQTTPAAGTYTDTVTMTVTW